MVQGDVASRLTAHLEEIDQKQRFARQCAHEPIEIVVSKTEHRADRRTGIKQHQHQQQQQRRQSKRLWATRPVVHHRQWHQLPPKRLTARARVRACCRLAALGLEEAEGGGRESWAAMCGAWRVASGEWLTKRMNQNQTGLVWTS